MPLVRYIIGAAAYGAARKIPILYDARLGRSWRREESRPMLLSEKAAVLLVSTTYSPVLTPFWLLRDLGRAEVWIRGERPERFGFSEPDDYFEYVVL